jgi:hypothetical protein
MMDIAIVGGGISGLYMAWLLLYNGKAKNVYVYEKSNRWGGRIQTVRMEDGSILEAGGSRFNQYHKHVIKLIKELGLWESNTILLPPDSKYYIKNSTHKRNIDTTKISAWIVERAKHYSPRYLKSISLEMFCRQIQTTPEDTDDYISAFAYNSFFETMNAYDGLHELQKNLKGNERFWILKNGMNDIVTKLVERLSKVSGFKGYLNHGVSCYDHDEVALTFDNGTRKKFDKVMFALTKPQLLAIKGLVEGDMNLKKTLDSLYDTPLHRIYAKFPLDDTTGYVWFHNLPKITTNNPLRYIIPISYKNGVVMISYTDGKYAWMWNDIKKSGLDMLQNQIMIHLRKLFPNILIPDPEWIYSKHWNTGVHYWAPHAIKYKNKRNNRHAIFGEVISFNNQGWIEGSLDSTLSVYKQLFKN